MYWRLQRTSKPLSTQGPFPFLETTQLQAHKLGKKLVRLSPRTLRFPSPTRLHTSPRDTPTLWVRQIRHLRRPRFIRPQ